MLAVPSTRVVSLKQDMLAGKVICKKLAVPSTRVVSLKLGIGRPPSSGYLLAVPSTRVVSLKRRLCWHSGWCWRLAVPSTRVVSLKPEHYDLGLKRPWSCSTLNSGRISETHWPPLVTAHNLVLQYPQLGSYL